MTPNTPHVMTKASDVKECDWIVVGGDTLWVTDVTVRSNGVVIHSANVHSYHGSNDLVAVLAVVEPL